MSKEINVYSWKVWRPLEIGQYKDLAELKRAFMGIGFWVGDCYDFLFQSPDFIVSTNRVRLNLVNPSIIEMGFLSGASYCEVSKRAVQLGLKMCMPEICIHNLIQYPTPIAGQRLFIPITD